MPDSLVVQFLSFVRKLQSAWQLNCQNQRHTDPIRSPLNTHITQNQLYHDLSLTNNKYINILSLTKGYFDGILEAVPRSTTDTNINEEMKNKK